MLELNSLVACQNVALDIFTNQWIYISIVDTIMLLSAHVDGELAQQHPDIKHVIPGMTICATLWGTAEEINEEYEYRVTVVAPDGRETQEGQSNKFAFSGPYHRLLHKTALIATRLAGHYQYRLYIRKREEDWILLGRTYFSLSEISIEANPLEQTNPS